MLVNSAKKGNTRSENLLAHHSYSQEHEFLFIHFILQNLTHTPLTTKKMGIWSNGERQESVIASTCSITLESPSRYTLYSPVNQPIYLYLREQGVKWVNC